MSRNAGQVQRRTEPEYTIRDIVKLTGLPAETLRVWERRYGFPSPARSDKGMRLYGDADLERLTLIARALNAGHRISQLAPKSVSELKELFVPKRAVVDVDDLSPIVARLLSALQEDDEASLIQELRYAAVNLGPREFVESVAAPLTRWVGVGWSEGRLQIHHEHMLSASLTTQLRLIVASRLGTYRGLRVLLTTLPGELHGLGVEMLAAYLAALDAVPCSLGVSTPPDQIVLAIEAWGADALALSLSANTDVRAASLHLEWIAREVPRGFPVWVGGAGVALCSVPSTLTVVNDWCELESLVESCRQG